MTDEPRPFAHLSAPNAGLYRAVMAAFVQVGSPVDARWDPALAPAMRRAGVRLEEELFLDDLVQDLSYQ